MRQFELNINGIVQNVGFRYNIKFFAEKHGISGNIQNMADKSVKILFYGSEESLKILESYIKSNPGQSQVDNIYIKPSQKKIKFVSFDILY